MKTLLLGLFLVASSAQAAPSCLIVKHASAARQFFVNGSNWQYVAGDFPSGMKWKSNIWDRDIRKVKKLGGKVVILKPDYTAADLDEAKKSCFEE